MKKLLILCAAFLFVFLSLASVAGCQQQPATSLAPTLTSTATTTPTLTPTSTPTPTSTSIPTPSPTLTWTPTPTPTLSPRPVALFTYSSKLFFYSISYPPDYTVNDKDASAVIIEKPGIGGIVVIVDKVAVNSTPKNYLDAVVRLKKSGLPDWASSSQMEVTENGAVIGYKFDYSHSLEGKKFIGKCVVIKKGGYAYYALFETIESEWGSNSTLAARCVDSFISPKVATGSYTNAAIGLSIILPAGWSVVETGLTGNPVLDMSPPYDQVPVRGQLYIETVSPGTTAQQYSANQTSLLTRIQGVQVVSEGAFVFANGITGYESTVSINIAGQLAKSRAIVVVSGNRAYRLIFSGAPTDVEALSISITQLAKTLVVS